MREKLFVFLVVFILAVPIGSWAADTKGGEKEMFGEMKNVIPSDRIKTTDELYQKWQDVQAGKSKAIILT